MTITVYLLAMHMGDNGDMLELAQRGELPVFAVQNNGYY